MKRGIFLVAIWLLVMAAPALASQKPKGGPKPQAVTKSAKSPVKVQAKANTKAPSGPKTKTSVKTNTKIKTAPAAKTTKVKANTKQASTQTAPATGTVTLSPVQQKLKRNTNLAAKLQSRLPAGTDLMAAAAGFKSLGQFVSTVNAAHNHDLSFPLLKQRIVDDGMSLGQAMKDVR